MNGSMLLMMQACVWRMHWWSRCRCFECDVVTPLPTLKRNAARGVLWLWVMIIHFLLACLRPLLPALFPLPATCPMLRTPQVHFHQARYCLLVLPHATLQGTVFFGLVFTHQQFCWWRTPGDHPCWWGLVDVGHGRERGSRHFLGMAWPLMCGRLGIALIGWGVLGLL